MGFHRVWPVSLAPPVSLGYLAGVCSACPRHADHRSPAVPKWFFPSLLVEHPQRTVKSPNQRGRLCKVRTRSASISRIARNYLFGLKSNRVHIYTRHLHDLVLIFSGGVSCDGIQQSRQNRCGDSETSGLKFDEPRVTLPSTYHYLSRATEYIAIRGFMTNKSDT